ncbi:MAG: Gfo/Idh/MocA family oxidoreductase [Vicinamibacterales bacterium]
MTDLPQSWPRPSAPRPIVCIGGGGIVRTAHLPAYRRLSYPLAGVFDINPTAARQTAEQFGLPAAFGSLAEAARVPDAVFDLALPGDQIVGVLEQLPDSAAVLIQKPMGRDLADARRILRTCQARRMTAAVNLQLRFSPAMLALRALVERGTLGALTDIDLHLVIEQPWHLWTFMIGAPRLELVYHSIHYLDAIRGFAGEPRGVYCKAVAHPDTPQLRDTRSSIILDYGDQLRCSLVLNHTHRAGPRFKRSELMVEGTRGAARLVLGVNLAYPTGSPDEMQLFTGDQWEAVPLRGSWFTEAFEGPMSNLQRFIAGEDAALVSPVEDTIRTMALIDACYQSSDQGGTAIPSAC